MPKKGFLAHVFTKKYHVLDFIEPFVALPFGFLAVRLLEFRFDVLTLMLGFALLLIYLPALIVVFEGQKQQ